MAFASAHGTLLFATEDLDADPPELKELVLPLTTGGQADRVVGSVFADEDGDIYIEQSGDGENWDISTTYTVTGGDGKGFSEEIILPNVQIRYVNGAADQTEFRLFARASSAGSR